MLAPVLYYLVLKPISLLPFWLLYAFSDFAFLVVYRLIGYRRKVVLGNIKNAFPEKSDQEHLKIEKAFYKHLCDVLVETIKAFSLGEKRLNKRYVHENPELITELYKQNKNIIIAGGHYNNWEWLALSADLHLPNKMVALYTPLSNKFFDKKVRQSRGKYGLLLLPTKGFRDELDKINSGFGLILGSDQSPRKNQKAYWMTFLNQETGVQFGAEKLANEYDCPVAYALISKLKRGHYKIAYELVCEDPKQVEAGYITQVHTLKLERDIKANPNYWLWSHKRWKHKRPESEVLNQWSTAWGEKP